MAWQCYVGFLMCGVLFFLFNWFLCSLIKDEVGCGWRCAVWYLFLGYVAVGSLVAWVGVIIKLFKTGNCF